MALPVADTANASGGATATAGASSITWSHVVAAGTDVLLVATFAGARSATGVTYGGVALTKLQTVAANGTQLLLDLWYLVSPTAGTANVVASFGSTTKAGASALGISGVNTAAPFGTPATKTGAPSGTTTQAITVVGATGDLAIDFFATENGDTATITPNAAGETAAGGTTIGAPGSGATSYKGGFGQVASATSTTMSWSVANGTKWFAYVGVSIAATAGAFQQAVSGALTPTGDIAETLVGFPSGAFQGQITPQGTLTHDGVTTGSLGVSRCGGRVLGQVSPFGMRHRRPTAWGG